MMEGEHTNPELITLGNVLGLNQHFIQPAYHLIHSAAPALTSFNLCTLFTAF